MNVLFIEDNEALGYTIQNSFRDAYNIDNCLNGQDGLTKFNKKAYDLIILDYFLPDKNGIEICKQIRETDKKVPILILTTCDDKQNIAEALDAGADDYLTKPFCYVELNARMKALLRRVDFSRANKNLSIGEISIDIDKKTVWCGKKLLILSRQEYLLLKYLAANKGRLINRQEIFEHVWGREDYYNSNTIDVHIRRIRNKIKSITQKDYIESIYGFGYRVVER